MTALSFHGCRSNSFESKRNETSFKSNERFSNGSWLVARPVANANETMPLITGIFRPIRNSKFFSSFESMHRRRRNWLCREQSNALSPVLLSSTIGARNVNTSDSVSPFAGRRRFADFYANLFIDSFPMTHCRLASWLVRSIESLNFFQFTIRVFFLSLSFDFLSFQIYAERS